MRKQGINPVDGKPIITTLNKKDSSKDDFFSGLNSPRSPKLRKLTSSFKDQTTFGLRKQQTFKISPKKNSIIDEKDELHTAALNQSSKIVKRLL